MLQPITSPLLNRIPCHHGFFNNEGGLSKGIYKGLNCGLGSHDAQPHILANRRMVRQHFKANQLITAYQYHSAQIMHADDVLYYNHAMADGLITDRPKQLIGVLTADCGPFLCVDPIYNIIGAAHAGWRGAVNNIIPKLLDSMVALGAKRSNIIGALGPTIGVDDYEVSTNFRDDLMAITPLYSQYFTPKKANKFLFDLPAFIINNAIDCGIQMDRTYPPSTYNNASFYSCRYNSHHHIYDYGRMISVIML